MTGAIIDLAAVRPVLPRFPEYGICALESHHEKGFDMPLSRYDFWEVMLVLDGEGWVFHRGVRQKVGKKNLIVVPRGEAYRFEDSAHSPLRILCLCVRPAGGMKPLFSAVLPEKFSVLRKPSFCAEIAAGLRGILHEQSLPGPCGEQIVVARSLLLLARLKRPSGQAEAVIQGAAGLSARVRDYVGGLAGRYYEQETIEMAAARLRMSPKTLTRHFRAVTGTTRRQYIEELRLQNACRLLLENGQSVTSIAFACGFDDLSTFFRAFRAKHGISPGDWRGKHADR